MSHLNMFVRIFVLGGLLCASWVSRAVTYEVVLVGDPGNANDATGLGQVNYVYRIGKYPVTIGQYTDFLNAVAKEDTYNLYNSAMANIISSAGIQKNGTSPNYTYSVIDNGGSSENRPITGVSWFSAARFANWMANGQPTGSQTSSTTEDGAYTLNGVTSGQTVVKNITNPNTGAAPTYYIPLENEWYKAAYYSQALNSGQGGYYMFATQSNATPGNAIGSKPNQANWFDDTRGFAVTQSTTFNQAQYYLTDVSAFSGSASYYGTFDQTGNVWEMTAPLTAAYFVSTLGGGWFSNIPYIGAGFIVEGAPNVGTFNLGFRLGAP